MKLKSLCLPCLEGLGMQVFVVVVAAHSASQMVVAQVPTVSTMSSYFHGVLVVLRRIVALTLARAATT